MLLLAGWLGLGWGGMLQAQSIQKATTSYQNFVRLNNQNTDKASVYSALHQCYTDYVAALNNAQPNTSAYMQAKNGLRNIYPYLQNGAIYYSQKGNQNNALVFAQAYMDVPLMPAFKGETFPRDDYFPTMAYFTASGTYNIKQFDKAIKYFQVYLSTNNPKNRKDVYAFMAKACNYVHQYDLAKSVLREALQQYPSDFNLLSMMINNCIDTADNDNLQIYVSRALAIKPSDPTLLNIQGKLYEDVQDYQKALGIYNRLRQSKPRSLDVARHLSLCYYNLGVLYNNKASMENNKANIRRYTNQSKEYFNASIEILQQVVASDPTSLKYLQALATAYSFVGNSGMAETTNGKILALGGQPVQTSDMPSMVGYSNSRSNVQPQAKPATTTPSYAHSGNYPAVSQPVVSSGGEAPLYSAYAKEYVESRIKTWQEKDPYETVSEYRNRVTEATRKEKIAQLLNEAKTQYIDTYAGNVRLQDLQLKPYDAENRVFLVESKYGELIVPVPREHNEAKIFESSWSGMQLRNPEFYINNDKLMLSGLTFVTPTGNTYRFDGDKQLAYTETVVDVNFSPIADLAVNTATDNGNSGSVRRQKQNVSVGASDVDLNIPRSAGTNSKTFAVIISNEHYDMVTQVPMAVNDGEVFARYCEQTLGLPKDNVRLYTDASYGIMIRAINDIKSIASAYNGDVQVIFYYAGHGIPNEETKDAYLLPVDADGTQTEGCYSLNRLYSELGSMGAQNVVVFLDACFSGAKRDGGMLASARGVALKAKKEDPKGNMVIFSAASDAETAFPYQEKGHGLFTYFLLKKLQESKGNATLQELGDYVTREVKRQSVVVNRKPQTPTVTPSESMAASWKTLRLK